ncbi:uncharacterized protein LOC119402654 [Rhipicephalus sanguineus]|uniref:uncharacterized protein LOC119402654 n=1 Tax=Rhipicephalus sanguineus TaxID=34632 RepID=UPI001892EF06|nr:uncharacterized protein LOC119402654 [Rhipicephalus sanguineus]
MKVPLLNMLVISLMVVKVNAASVKKGEEVMEKIGEGVVVAGQTVGRLFKALVRGAKTKIKESHINQLRKELFKATEGRAPHNSSSSNNGAYATTIKGAKSGESNDSASSNNGANSIASNQSASESTNAGEDLKKRTKEMKELALLNMLVLLMVITKVNAKESVAEKAMEKVGQVAVIAGQTAKKLFKAMVKGARKQMAKSKAKSSKKAAKAVEERTWYMPAVSSTSSSGTSGNVYSVPSQRTRQE